MVETLTICAKCNGGGGSGLSSFSISCIETSFVINDLYSLRHSAGNILSCPVYLISGGMLYDHDRYIVTYDNTPFETYYQNIIESRIIPLLFSNFLAQYEVDDDEANDN